MIRYLPLVAWLLAATSFGGEPLVQIHVEDLLNFQHRNVRNFKLCDKTRRLFVSHTDDRNDDRLYQWNVDSKTIEHVYHLGEGYTCDDVALSPDGQTAVVGCLPRDLDRWKILLLDTNEKTIARKLGHTGRIFQVQFNTSGSRFVMRTSETINLPDAAFTADGESLAEIDPAEFAVRENKRVWRVAASKLNLNAAGFYFRDDRGQTHKVADDIWHDNFAASKDGRFLAATTWGGELVIWRLSDGMEAARKKMAQHYGYLQYDSVQDRFLWGDATHDGVTMLKSIEIARTLATSAP